MVNPRYLTDAVEDCVRDILSLEYEVVFSRQTLKLQPGGYHEFDAVSDNRRIVASIKTTSGGRHPVANALNCVAELYFLSIAPARKRLLVMTSRPFREVFLRTMNGKIPSGVRVVHVALPPMLEARVAAVQDAGSEEIHPVLDAEELRTLGAL